MKQLFLVGLVLFSTPVVSPSMVITSQLGNLAPGFADGSTPTTAQVIAAQSGQPAPFETGKGNDAALFGAGNLSETWTHTFGSIADPILSATFTLGIADHDSAATGNQIANFTIDGVDFTAALNALAEAPGEGEDRQFDLFTINLPGSSFAGLADGNVPIALALGEPGLVFNVLLMIEQDAPSNGAFLISSELVINTQSTTPVPEPSTLLLLLAGAAVLHRARHPKRRA